MKGLTSKTCQEHEKAFKEINNEDINENFLGAFPSDKINKFNMF